LYAARLRRPWRRSDLIFGFSFQSSECETSHGCHVDPDSFPFPSSGSMSRRPIHGESKPSTPSRVPPHDDSRVGRATGEGGTLRTSFSLSCARARLGMWRTGGGSFTIGSLAWQRHGHLGPLTTNFISSCGLSTFRSRFDAFHIFGN